MSKAFSLIELIIIVIIVAVLATFVIPGYFGVQRRIRERNADAMLRLIQAAERATRLNTQSFVACNNTADCNSKLKLYIPTPDYWNYTVKLISNNTDFCAEATASNNANIKRSIKSNTEPTNGGC